MKVATNPLARANLGRKSRASKPSESLQAAWLRLHGIRERRLASELARFFKRQARNIAARIKQLKTLESGLLYHPHSWDSALLAVLRTAFPRTATAAADFELQLLKSAKLPSGVMGKIKAGVNKVLGLPLWSKINQTTKEILDKTLDAAKKAGSTLADVAKAVVKTLGGKAADARAADMARTETTGCMGLGAEAVRQYAAEFGSKLSKMWVTMGDDLVREAHQELDGVTIPHDQSFSIGGHRAAHPGDWNLPADMRCGCRCWTVTLSG